MAENSATLTLYLRDGCYLCEDMEQLLYELLEPGSFELQRIDIDQDDALKSQYNEHVPVLIHRGQEICRHFLDLEAVLEVLAGYNRANDPAKHP